MKNTRQYAVLLAAQGYKLPETEQFCWFGIIMQAVTLLRCLHVHEKHVSTLFGIYFIYIVTQNNILLLSWKGNFMWVVTQPFPPLDRWEIFVCGTQNFPSVTREKKLYVVLHNLHKFPLHK